MPQVPASYTKNRSPRTVYLAAMVLGRQLDLTSLASRSTAWYLGAYPRTIRPGQSAGHDPTATGTRAARFKSNCASMRKIEEKEKDNFARVYTHRSATSTPPPPPPPPGWGCAGAQKSCRRCAATWAQDSPSAGTSRDPDASTFKAHTCERVGGGRGTRHQEAAGRHHHSTALPFIDPRCAWSSPY